MGEWLIGANCVAIAAALTVRRRQVRGERPLGQEPIGAHVQLGGGAQGAAMTCDH